MFIDQPDVWYREEIPTYGDTVYTILRHRAANGKHVVLEDPRSNN